MILGFNHTVQVLPDLISNELARFKYVFNPSFCFDNDTEYWAFRCYDEKIDEIICLIYVIDKAGDLRVKFDLNQIFLEKYGIRPADPKLFAIKDKVCCTLNSGYKEMGENDIYFIEIGSNELTIRKCIIKKHRKRIEKNWMFFEHENSLMMLYSISPKFVVYKKRTTNSESLIFDHLFTQNLDSLNLTIGTPIRELNGKFYLVAHQKIKLGKKRIYIGVPVSFDISSQKLQIGKKRLVHSIVSLFGAKHKFNKNLISCSYFSGIRFSLKEGSALLGYGINDHHWNIIRVKIEDLWH